MRGGPSGLSKTLSGHPRHFLEAPCGFLAIFGIYYFWSTFRCFRYDKLQRAGPTWEMLKFNYDDTYVKHFDLQILNLAILEPHLGV